VNAIRDIKIMGMEQIFSSKNDEIVSDNVSVYSKYQTIGILLRVLIETIMFCSIVFVCVAFVVSNVNIIEYAPLIATISLVAVKFAPSFSKIANYYNIFKMSYPLVNDILESYQRMGIYSQIRTSTGLIFQGAYRVSGLRFGYGNNLVVDDASISIPQGKVVGLIGTSGSGKSTVLDLLSGLQEPKAGVFQIGDQIFNPSTNLEFCNSVGYVSQQISLIDATVEFNICLEENPDLVRFTYAIQKAQLVDYIATLSKGKHNMLGDGYAGLSGGQRQRIGVARALYRQPKLLIFDEITSALDELTASALLKDLYSLRGEVTMLFVTHDLRFLQTDYLYEMRNGKLILISGSSCN
jgi:ABC-type bacteriocin/lantibiotic exporter with double-glycine peptidase domain